MWAFFSNARTPLLAICTAVLFPTIAAADCWIAGNFRGQTATADNAYRFTQDGFADGMSICFTEDSGVISGNDLPLVRVGRSTLVGFSVTEHGLEVVNVYQIDRANSTLLLTQSRIGTATITPLLPDYAGVFVAEVVRR